MNTNWILHFPAPDRGTLVPGVYNLGPVLMDEEHTTTPQDGKLQIVTGVTEADFEHYVDTLKASGVRETFSNTLGRDRYFGFETADGLVCQVTYAHKRGQLRIAEDPLSMAPDRFGYTAKGPVQPMVWQYGLYYDPENNVTDKTVNCGMMYIIRLSDNSLFLIDSGHRFQWNRQAVDALWAFLRRITGTPENGTVRIACWYFTHAHSDHTHGCICLLETHHSQIRLERVMMGFCAYQTGKPGYDAWCHDTKRTILKYYPEAAQLHLHSGQKFPLADITCELLYTQEDGVTPENPTAFPFRDFNCTSSILKVTLGGKIIQFLGDTNVETEDFLKENSDPSIWPGDLVQVAHHCFNYLDTLYAWIHAPVVMVPNSQFGAHHPTNQPKLDGAVQFAKDGAVYFEGDGTTGFSAEADGFRKTDFVPLVGGPYDGSFGIPEKSFDF